MKKWRIKIPEFGFCLGGESDEGDVNDGMKDCSGWLATKQPLDNMPKGVRGRVHTTHIYKKKMNTYTHTHSAQQNTREKKI